MRACPVCLSDTRQDICSCGHSFPEDKIIDWKAARSTLGSIPKGDWQRRVQFSQRANRVQIAKLGSSVTNRSGQGWSQTRTAKELGIQRTTMSGDLRLAEALAQYPRLAQCPNKSRAHAMLQELEAAPGTSETTADHPGEFGSESALQQYLEQNWDSTEFGMEWSLYRAGQVDTAEVGIMDLLAKHKDKPRWLVIELKVGETSDRALGQVLRYMGWVKRGLADRADTVSGAIIAAYPDLQTLYGLDCVPDVRLYCYSRTADGLEFREESLMDHYIAALSPEQMERLSQRLSVRLQSMTTDSTEP